MGVDAGLERVVALIGPYHRIFNRKVTGLKQWREVLRWPPEHVREAALALHAMACQDTLEHTIQGAVLCGLVELDAPWTAADLSWCLEQAAAAVEADTVFLHYELPSVIASRLPEAELAPFRPALARLLDEIRRERFMTAVRRQRLMGLLGSRGLSPQWFLHANDEFGRAVRLEYAEELARPGVAEFVAHCACLPKLSPDAKWRKRSRELLALDGVKDVAVLVVERYIRFDGKPFYDTDLLLRGLLCALAEDPAPAVTDLLARAVTRAAADSGYGSVAASAGVELLAGRQGSLVATTLARLALSVQNKALAKRVRAALAPFGTSLSEALELAVDDHGLDAQARHTETLGGFEATIQIVHDKVPLTFTRDGKPLKSVPAALKQDHAADLKRLKELSKRIGQGLTAERIRVEGMLSQERTWSHADWVARYLEHPVTSALGCRLIWETCDSAQAGLPVCGPDGWMLETLGGEAIQGSRVRLWHPARATPGEVSGWRDHVIATGLRQPFKQAFREVYRLTPAEEETATYSNRFAAHILRYRQANALMRVRGWSASYLGGWSGGYDSEAVKEFGGGAWRASFHHSLVETEGTHEAVYCSTDQVRFARTGEDGGRAWVDTPLTDVPPLVFSEAMRDVDLFVGVTSIAADPEWTDRGVGAGEDRFRVYWRDTSFGDLTASAEVRREALARILPRTKLAGRVELGERFLRVRGVRRGYRIHLGSGNILMEPNDSYLCIVAGRRIGGDVFLPFEEDPMLSMILSKALLLAADDKITDPSILRQLDG